MPYSLTTKVPQPIGSPTHALAPGLTIAPSPIHGRGCFTTQPIARGSKIAHYAGERITWDEAMYRRQSGRGDCICDLEDGSCIDGKFGGNGTEFINHSCTPNCGSIYMQGALVIYALCDIAPHQELTVNYYSSLTCAAIPCCCPTCKTRPQP